MPNKDPTGAVVNNAVQLKRYGNGLAREIAAIIDGRYQDIVALLMKRDPTVVVGANRKRRLKALNGDADRIFAALYAEMREKTKGSLVELAEVQEAWAQAQLNRAIGSVAVEVGSRKLGRQFWRALITEDPTEGAILGDWWKRQQATARFGFRRQVQTGMANQETIGDIVRRVRGRSIGRGRYEGGVMGTTTREATALVRTAVNQIANRAHFETYKANSDITEKYRYVATLDDRTTEICASLDGKEFEYGKGPLPPQHWNCRSTTVPIVDWEKEGFEAPKEGTRAALGGPVKAGTNYEQWLRDQSAGTQAKVLGVGKAKLFREGEIGLADLIRKDGSVVSLQELKEKIST